MSGAQGQGQEHRGPEQKPHAVEREGPHVVHAHALGTKASPQMRAVRSNNMSALISLERTSGLRGESGERSSVPQADRRRGIAGEAASPIVRPLRGFPTEAPEPSEKHNYLARSA
jgi:hypothetical protein